MASTYSHARFLTDDPREHRAKMNILIDTLARDLSWAIDGGAGGLGDVKSPVSPGSTDGFVVLWDGVTGKRLKNSLIDGAWFNQSVTSLSSPTFAGAEIARLGVNMETMPNTPLMIAAISDSDPIVGLIGGGFTKAIAVLLSEADDTLTAYSQTCPLGSFFTVNLTSGNVGLITVNELTLSKLAVGFSIAGGTISKTLTVPLDATVSGTNTGDQDLSGYLATTAISNSVYDATWDGDTTHAPTKNVLYDKIETIVAGSGISESLAIAYAVALG